jgi:hypothetical protein
MPLSCCEAMEVIQKKDAVMCGGHEVSGSERPWRELAAERFDRSASSDFGQHVRGS